MNKSFWRSLIALLLLACCASVRAEVQVCNEYPEPVFVAVGWVEKGDTKTKGWWRVNKDACVVVDNRSLQRPHYIYAETAWHQLPDGSKTMHHWGNKVKLAIGKSGETFNYVHSQTIAKDDNTAMFSNLASNIEGDIAHVTYTIKADGKTTSTSYTP